MTNTSSPRPSARWSEPSPRVAELLRQGAEIALKAPQEWLDELDQASFPAEHDRFLAEDPVLIAATRRINRGGLIHWAAANLERPGAPVPPFVSKDMLANARELIRKGATDLIFSSSRSAHHTAWQLWMNIAFGLTQNPLELRELLDISSRSIADFIDGSVSKISEFIRNEREAMTRGSHVDRRELVSRIIEGAAIPSTHASQRLGYVLDQTHHAAIIWTEEPDTPLAQLEAAADTFVSCAGATTSLNIMAHTATLWAWCNGSRGVDAQRLEATLRAVPGVRVALGSSERGVEGFRRAHLDALSAQRLVARLQSGARVVHFDQVRLTSLVSHHAEDTQQFISHTLGKLAEADPILRSSLLTFLAAGSNVTEAAKRLHTHRNTLLRRLSKAEDMLPRPLSAHLIHVGAALEVLRWSLDTQSAPTNDTVR